MAALMLTRCICELLDAEPLQYAARTNNEKCGSADDMFSGLK